MRTNERPASAGLGCSIRTLSRVLALALALCPQRAMDTLNGACRGLQRLSRPVPCHLNRVCPPAAACIQQDPGSTPRAPSWQPLTHRRPLALS